MLVKAKISFAGEFSMYRGEVKECSDEATLQDLLDAEYVEIVEAKTEKDVKSSESKRNNNKKSS